MTNFTEELNQKLVREKLNADQIKLWLPPYTLENGEKGEEPQDIITRYSSELKFSKEELTVIMETLRQHALQKLAERNQFQKDGIATLKIKLPTTQTCTRQVTSVKIKLEDHGKILREMVAELCGTPAERLKLITSGHIITDDKPLKEQFIKNGSQIMTILLSLTDVEAVEKEKEADNINKTRQAAELLSARAAKDDTDYDVQIADQNGRPLKLPKEEKQALTLAMTLHEKGRNYLKKKNLSSALLLLLEAEKEFRKCRASILDAVDNYAILCLDIVWCYLCLKNLDQLPDADRRLRASEECFIRSYGSNMERVTAVKGGSETEMALFVRLHLLQGIVAFHQHDVDRASRLLKQAEDDVKRLSVDPDQITEVMTMGFSEREARLGLRACKGNLQQSIDYIMQKKQEKEEIRNNVKADRENRKKLRKLGKTANGEWVSPQNFEMLLKMGFRQGPAAEALRQANNDVTLALDVLRNKPELFNLPDPVDVDIPITDTMIAQLCVLGFESEMCRRALTKHHGDISQAAADLAQSGGFLEPIENFSSGSSNSSTSSDASVDEVREREVLDNLVSDIKQDADEYLDLNLEEEKQFLSEYKALLDSIH